MEPACPSALEICSDFNDVKKRIYFFHQLNARESPWYQMVSMEPKPNFQNKNIDSSLLLSLCVKTFFFRQISQSFLIWSLLLHAVGKTKLPWRAPMFLLLSMSHSYWSSGTFSPSSWAQLWWFAPDSVSPSTMVPTQFSPLSLFTERHWAMRAAPFYFWSSGRKQGEAVGLCIHMSCCHEARGAGSRMQTCQAMFLYTWSHLILTKPREENGSTVIYGEGGWFNHFMSWDPSWHSSWAQTRIQYYICLTTYSVYFPLLQYHFPDICHWEHSFTEISSLIAFFTCLGLSCLLLFLPHSFSKSFLPNLFRHPPWAYST